MQKRPRMPTRCFPVDLPEGFPFSCHDSVQDDRPIVSLHWHSGLEIGICHEGTGVFMIQSKVLPFRPGDIVVIGAGQCHLARSKPHSVSCWTWVYCDPVRILGYLFPLSDVIDCSVVESPSFCPIYSTRDDPGIAHLVTEMIQELRTAGRYREDVLRCHLFTFCVQLRRGHRGGQLESTKKVERRDIDAIMPAIVHIHNNYENDIPGSILAQLCCMSLTNFRRTFRKQMHTTPKCYLNHLRITTAAVELSSSTRSISEIAAAVGFGAQSSFNRQFRAVTGKTPREWRSGSGDR